MSGLDDALRGRRVVVCVGSGGVGKTSVAAAVALRAALEGRRALVVTFDPSRRLATSLGLEGLQNAPQPLPLERFEAAGLKPLGELLAMHLDVKRTMDDLFRRHAGTPAQAEAILENRLYKSLSTVLPGAHEYMAMEKLYELNQDERYDLLVLDTPPASAALDLLEAPQRVLAAFDREALRWIANPAVLTGQLGGKILSHLAAFTGGAMLEALAEFLLSLQDMIDGFRERARAVQALLASQQTTFLLVAAPDPLRLEEALRFYGVLRLHEVAVDTVVVNRVQPDWRAAAGEDELSAASLGQAFGSELGAVLAEIVAEQQVVADAHAAAVDSLRGYLEEPAMLRRIPALADDPHDLAALAAIAEHLFVE